MATLVKKILLVDDEKKLLNSLAQRLTLLGFEPIKASSGTQAIEIAGNTQLDMAIVDLNMPDMDGLTTISRLKEITPDLKTVLLTGYGSRQTLRETKALGAGYFEKDSMGDLWDLIKRLNAHGNAVVVNAPEKGAQPGNPSHLNRIEVIGAPYGQKIDPVTSRGNVDSLGRSFGDLPKIVGETPQMQELRKGIERLSGLDCTVMIKGETGTGKELAARAIHTLSHRKGQRFLAFNCGCFSNDFHFNELLASLEESGPRHGSKNAGAMEKGFTGTILLDHLETMPAKTQQEMIKIIDNKAANRRAGDAQAVVDIRFIVATHEDLKKRVEKEKFNKELYLKLNAIDMSVPSLRDRRDDLKPLCSYFLSQLNREFDKHIESISDSVISIFMAYEFPGNVRELKHIIERAVILSDSTTIEIRHLPERFTTEVPASPLSDGQNFLSLGELEQDHILKALTVTKGNKSKAAEILGISRAALWRKLKLINAEE